MTTFAEMLDDYIVAYVHWYDANLDSFASKRDEARAAVVAYVAALDERIETDAALIVNMNAKKLQAWKERDDAMDRVHKLTAALAEHKAELDRAAAWAEKSRQECARLTAENARLALAIAGHNAGQVSSCEWRRKQAGSYADYCAAYTGRGRICPDCPRHDIIELEPKP